VTSASGVGRRSDRLIVSVFDGIWRVRWENGEEVHSSRIESEAWERAKWTAERDRAEALLIINGGEVRFRADFRDDA